MRTAICMLLLQTILIIILLSPPFAKGRYIGNSNSIIKTIQVGDEDVIDCIDVHKQLALTHPLLWNHAIQMEPSMQATKSKAQHNTVDELRQSWHKYGRCPRGSIPISRNDYQTSIDNPPKRNAISLQDGPINHPFAITQTKGTMAGKIQGALATINLWKPIVNPVGESISQVWIVAGDSNNLNTIEAGWRVFNKSGRYEPRLFVSWTKDNYKSTGCFDLDCPGFVQVNKDVKVGSILSNLSVYGRKQTVVSLHIQKDPQSGNWWLSMHSKPIGYWPSAIFTSLANGGDKVMWGGKVDDAMTQDNKTVTQMGSGHFPSEGVGKASYIRDIKYIDSSTAVIAPTDVFVVTTNPSCYDAKMIDYMGFTLIYGGPGCQPPK